MAQQPFGSRPFPAPPLTHWIKQLIKPIRATHTTHWSLINSPTTWRLPSLVLARAVLIWHMYWPSSLLSTSLMCRFHTLWPSWLTPILGFLRTVNSKIWLNTEYIRKLNMYRILNTEYIWFLKNEIIRYNTTWWSHYSEQWVWRSGHSVSRQPAHMADVRCTLLDVTTLWVPSLTTVHERVTSRPSGTVTFFTPPMKSGPSPPGSTWLPAQVIM